MVDDCIKAEEEQHKQTLNRVCTQFGIEDACFVNSITKHQTDNDNINNWNQTVEILTQKKEIWKKFYQNNSGQQ